MQDGAKAGAMSQILGKYAAGGGGGDRGALSPDAIKDSSVLAA